MIKCPINYMLPTQEVSKIDNSYSHNDFGRRLDVRLVQYNTSMLRLDTRLAQYNTSMLGVEVVTYCGETYMKIMFSVTKRG